MSYYNDESRFLYEEDHIQVPRPSSPYNNGKNGRNPKKKQPSNGQWPHPKKTNRYASKQNVPNQQGKAVRPTEYGHLNNRRGNSRRGKVLGHKGSLKGIPASRGSLRGTPSSASNGSIGSRSKRINAQIRAANAGQVTNNLQTKTQQGGNNNNRPPKARNGRAQQQQQHKKRTNHQGKNNKRNKGKRKGNARSRENVRHAKSVSSIELIEKGQGGKHYRSKRSLHGSKESVFLCPCGRIPWWCFLLITTMVVVLAAVAVGVVFLVNSSDRKQKTDVDLLFGSRCRDTFLLYPNQYHQESIRVKSINTLKACIDRCLDLPRVRCAAINYNKDGRLGNRCYLLEYEALSYKHGYYTGVDEHLRQMCDSVRVVSGTNGGNPSSGSQPGSSTSSSGFSTTEASATAPVCEATYTMSADQFGVGGVYLEAAKTVEECLEACSSIPNCPAIEYDHNVGTCYIHRSQFDSRLFTAARVDHYDRQPCPSTLPITGGPMTVRTTSHLATVLMRTTVKPTPVTSRRMTTLPWRKTTQPGLTGRQTGRTSPPAMRTTQDVTSKLSTASTTMTTTTTTTTTTAPTTTPATTTTTTATNATTTTTTATNATASTTASTTLPTSPFSTTSTSTLSSMTTTASGLPPSTTSPPSDENCEEDLTIIIDMSGPSDGPNSKNFPNTINLAQNVINNMRIGPGAVRVSVIIFSTLAFTSFHLNRNHSKADVLYILDQLQFIGGLANLPRAMKLWFDDHKPQSDLLGRKSNVLLLSDVHVSNMFEAAFTHEAGRWRTLTFQGELSSIVASTTDVHTVNMDRFTPLHTFTVIDYYDQSLVISGIINLLPHCKDPRPMPFDRFSDRTPAPPPAVGSGS